MDPAAAAKKTKNSSRFQGDSSACDLQDRLGSLRDSRSRIFFFGGGGGLNDILGGANRREWKKRELGLSEKIW